MASSGTQLERKPAAGSGAQISAGMSALWIRSKMQWASMAPAQRKWAIAIALMAGSLLGGILWYGLRADWRTLYAGLDPDDARQTGLTLTQAQIPFDVMDRGTEIRVPVSMLDKARLATAAKGSLKSGRMGFELFDKPNWVGSEFDERVNYQRALEGELEHTVGSLADIESARVHLVLAHDSLFRDQERPAKASVVLRLRHASLADGEPDAIRNLVAAAVDGLTADRVVLVDAAGHLPLGPKTAASMQLSEEQGLEEKLISTLEAVTGPGNVRASVTLEHDSSATEETREIYDPTQSVTLSMQRTEQSTASEPVPAGIPGTASNAPNSQALPVYPRQTTLPQTAKTESGTYGVSKTFRHVVENPGKLRRLTAAIVVNDRLVRVASRGLQAQWQQRSADELRHLTALAQGAVGYDAARGDSLTVENLAFDENRPLATPSLPAQLVNSIETSPTLARFLTLVIGFLVILFFGIRPAMRHALNAQIPSQPTRALPEHSDSAAPEIPPRTTEPVLDAERKQAQEILEQVSSQLKREPAQSSRLLQSWIHSE
jgi:flagellar M-ring protein FliF